MSEGQRNETVWRNPDNWKPLFGKWLTFYASRKDGRILVPKRNDEVGFTVNAGHPVGKAILLFVTVVVPLLIVSAIVLGIVLAG